MTREIAIIKSKIKEMCGCNTPIYLYSSMIIDFMIYAKPQELRMITYRDIIRETKLDDINNELLSALTILTSDKINFLEIKAFFHDDDNNEDYEISFSDIREAKNKGGMPHPSSGQLVINFSEHIIPYFSASPYFIGLMSNV